MLHLVRWRTVLQGHSWVVMSGTMCFVGVNFLGSFFLNLTEDLGDRGWGILKKNNNLYLWIVFGVDINLKNAVP